LKLLIVGDGPEKGSLVHLVHKLGLSSGDHAQADVWFTGAINRITPYIRFATASLMNSVSEGFPNSMIESLFYKTPVISADCPYGPREIFEAGEGRVLDKIYPVKTGGGVLLQNVNTSSEEMWKNVLLDFVNKKFPVENTFYERLILSVSKDNVIDKWQSIIK
ncbi:MAG: glycosyltransferase, partial [Cyclobacteriaceae bacterium]|nr:glycosyltransferase [Cyclobacteriaceae bacterium]